MEALTDRELEDLFEESFNDAHGPLIVAGMEKDHAQVLKEIDNTAYRTIFNEWLDDAVEYGNLFEQDGEYYYEDPSEQLDGDDEEE